MIRRDEHTRHRTELRRRAENLAREKEAISLKDQKVLSLEESRQMLHELRVHQIQLEMQNEELLRTQQEIEDVKTRYFDLYDLAPVGYCTINESGLILEANLTAASLLGIPRGELINSQISRFIFKEDQDIYYLHQKNAFEVNSPQVCELRMIKRDKTLFWVQLVSTSERGIDEKPLYRIVLSDLSLKVSHAQLRNLSQHKEKLREDERKRIARELHDELGQLLTALKFDLLLLGNDYRENKELVERIEVLDHYISNTIMKTVQEISTKLRPAVLDKIGLKAAIEWLSEELKLRNSISSEIVTNFEESDISSACSTTLFRIIQESFTNMVRHAQASSVKVSLIKRKNNLELIIKDNGQGFNESIVNSSNSLGLLGMRERAISINGDLKIESHPGKGTSIKLSVPLIKDDSK